MRIAVLCILGVFLWAGTISIKYPQQSSTVTASSGQICSGQSDADTIMAFLEMGTITNIHDNGQILTIGLSPQWAGISPAVQRTVYNTVLCYAQSQHRQFQFFVTQQI